MKFYKYQGAGNDFLIADNRDGHITEKEGLLTAVLEDGTLWQRSIESLCDRRYGVGADGLMLLEAGRPIAECRPIADGRPETEKLPATEDRSMSPDQSTDFQMVYFNSDGSGGMMCGNGGRCIVAFAKDCGVEGETDSEGIKKYIFTAADGLHEAYVLEDTTKGKTIRLKMKDVDECHAYETLTGVNVPSEGYFLDTGTRHYVRFVDNLEEYDIVSEGRDIRYNAVELQPIGANVNYVEPCGGALKVRTYEKGVEDETFACGTGIVASALASYIKGVDPSVTDSDSRLHYNIRAKKDRLAVDFIPESNGLANDIHLTGPAAFVCKIEI